MKQLLVILVLVLAGCAGKQDPVTPVQTSAMQFSPVFSNGAQFYSTDGGATWEPIPTLAKLIGCACGCTMSNSGLHPGTCGFAYNDVSCEEWCTYGGKR